MLRRPQLCTAFCLISALAIGLASFPASANPSVYEPGADPGVGFNLISWWNFGGSGASIWENAVQKIYDAGFDEVSISPVRFVETSSSAADSAGTIATTSGRGPELSHIAAGIVRAKSLGMRVTVNPFVELKNGIGFFENANNSSSWRGFYDPTPFSGEWTTFWNDYEQYLVDVAQVAEANGADSMTVGTELKAITQNNGNNPKWNSVIGAVNAAFSGTLGYAANWDNYQNSNLTNVMWEHPAIDYIGIDSYFEGLLNNPQADASGTYPNSTFIDQVESAWNTKLDTEILPFAASRKAGSGMPIEFTEIGHLPYNRTIVTPQNSSGTLDKDEQNMAFEGLMRALDGRLGTGEFLATHLWNWGMPGTGGNLWDMGVSGGEPHTNNVQTSQWLSNFVSNPVFPENADFNEDGAIDGNDFLALQIGLGTTSGASLAQGDANSDGAVNHLDLAIWETQYGAVSTLAAAAAVPEPASLPCLLVGAILWLYGKRLGSQPSCEY